MVDLDRLERLNRLRKSGALSDGEFQIQKSQLLADYAPQSRQDRLKWPWWALPFVVGAVVLGVLLIPNWRGAQPATGNSVASNETFDARAVKETTKVPPAASERPPAAPLAFATSGDVIGINPAFLEKRLGVPRRKNDAEAEFVIGGCSISYSLQGNEVTGFSVDVGPRCHPTIQGRLVTPQTTLGQLRAKEDWGSYVASCLTGCGNAADPTIDLFYPGSRATQFVGVSYVTDYNQVSSALEAWEKAVRRQQGLGEFDVPNDYDPFMCVTDPPAAVAPLIRSSRVRTVRVGRELLTC